MSGLDVPALADAIERLQRADGRIAWIDAGLFDPWNHCEAAMGLAAAGRSAAARKALDHLVETQSPEGSWIGDLGCAVPLDDGNEKLVVDAPPQIVDVNFCAYPALAVRHLCAIAGERSIVAAYQPMIDRAIDFVLAHQRADGAFAWRALEPREALGEVEALLAGSASIYKSLEAAAWLAEVADRPRDHLDRARARLGEALRDPASRFAPKPRFAMDWYYPALTGALPGARGRTRLAARWSAFVHPVWGCRCVDDQPWATAAETAELVMACAAVGRRDDALRLLAAVARHADEDGALWMGWQFAENRVWPLEKPSWTAGAAILAVDAVERRTPGAAVMLDAEPERIEAGAK